MYKMLAMPRAQIIRDVIILPHISNICEDRGYASWGSARYKNTSECANVGASWAVWNTQRSTTYSYHM